MTLTERKNAFAALGGFLKQFASGTPEKAAGIPHNDLFFGGMLHQIRLSEESNNWFTASNIAFALKSWADALTKSNLDTWLNNYTISEKPPKTVALITAGNIPLVGFHDLLCVLAAGHKAMVKLSSKDKHLLPFLAKYLEYAEPKFKGRILFTEEKLENFDAVIATGSGNTARYFDYYFGKYPHIIRKNRNSAAVLSGKETETQLKALGEDIFRHFGLGCRNVSKIFVPENYDFNLFFKAVYPWGHLMENKKYMNNYDYNKAVYLMSLFPVLENGFVMLKEDTSYSSPIATLFYEYYTSKEELKNRLSQDADKIQCVVSEGFTKNEVPFGKTQQPNLWDYADNIDTIEFLLKI